MSVAVDLAPEMRIADPKPAYCSHCMRGAEEGVTFVDFSSEFDAGSFIDKDGAFIRGSDDLNLCETCVRQAAELLDFKPTLHARHLQEIKKLEIARDHWHASDRRREAREKELEQFIEVQLGVAAPRRKGRTA